MATRLFPGNQVTDQRAKNGDGHKHSLQNGVVNHAVQSNGILGHVTVHSPASCKITQTTSVADNFIGVNGAPKQFIGQTERTGQVTDHKNAVHQNGSLNHIVEVHSKQNGVIKVKGPVDSQLLHKTLQNISSSGDFSKSKTRDRDSIQLEVHRSPGSVSKGKSPKSGRPGATVTFAEDVNREQNSSETSVPGTSKTNTFRNAVNRHFGKDRFFRLVQKLLNSVDDERKAQEDLIASFETARNIKVPGFEPPALPPVRVKRRRRKSTVLLAEKIELDHQLRKKNSLAEICESDQVKEVSKAISKETSERSVELSKGDVELVQSKDSQAKDNDYESESQERKTNDISSFEQKEITSKELKVKFHDTVIKDSFQETGDVNESDNRISDNDDLEEEQHLENTEDAIEDKKPSEKEEVDQLVLDSVLSNSFSCEKENEQVIVEPTVIVEVETDSDSECAFEDKHVFEIKDEYCLPQEPNPFSYYKGECIIVLSGEKEGMASSDEEEFCKYVEIEDLGDDGSDCDLKTLNERMANLSPVEYESKPKRKTRPKLHPIKEAVNSRSSFSSLHSKGSISSEKIEVRCESAMNKNHSNDDENISLASRTRRSPVSKKYEKVEENGNYNNRTRIPGKNCVRETTPRKFDKKDATVRKTPQQSKIISIDLIDVYNENEDLQKINKSEYLPKVRKRVKRASPRTKVGKPVKRPKSTVVSLPPKTLKSPRRVRAMSAVSSKSAPELSRRTEILDFYRSYQSQKDKSRHNKPDHVLWDNIDLSEESAVERYAELRDHSDTDEGSLTSLRRPQHQPNTLKVWDMPLKEAVRRVKSATNLPQPRALNDETPRHVRVQRMYAQVKKMRRASSSTVCKPLIYQVRRHSDFRV